MINLGALIKKTEAFKIMSNEKKKNSFSHAYLIISPDNENLTSELKIFAKLLACNDDGFCDNCRTCKLIEQGIHPDVIIYPKENKSVLTEDINALIEESYIKPIEIDKKIFIISHAEKMNAQAQNKLLKTLEEPPRGVHIIMGATSEFPLLPTIISRVKKLTVSPFGAEELFNALKEDCTDEDKLRQAISCGDGTVGSAFSLYNDQDLSSCYTLARDIILNMKSSKDVLAYSNKVMKIKDINELLSVLEISFRDMLTGLNGREDLVINGENYLQLKGAQGYNGGALIYILEKITQARKKVKFYANPVMLADWLLFAILEGKYKWQKL